MLVIMVSCYVIRSILMMKIYDEGDYDEMMIYDNEQTTKLMKTEMMR